MRRCDVALLRARLRFAASRARRSVARQEMCSFSTAIAPATNANADAVLSLLRDQGLTSAELDQLIARDPAVLTYDARHEVFPRLCQLAYLRDVSPAGRFAWQVQHETVAAFVLRQPFVLERRFGDVCVRVNGAPAASTQLVSPRAYYAISKPWDVRHDVPRGWPNVPQRFVPKHEGDDISAEEHVTAQCVNRAPWLWDTVRFAHQIDYATSGVLLACGTQQAAAAAASCFAKRSARKTYAALLLGDVPQDAWHVDAAIAHDETDVQKFKMRAAGQGEAGAKTALTEFKVLVRGHCALEGPWKGAPLALVAARPTTGRRHQIRVHAALHSSPVLGDCAYSPDRDTFRMFLHGWRLHLPGILDVARDECDDTGLRKKADLTLIAPLPRSFRVAFDGQLPADVDALADAFD